MDGLRGKFKAVAAMMGLQVSASRASRAAMFSSAVVCSLVEAAVGMEGRRPGWVRTSPLSSAVACALGCL